MSSVTQNKIRNDFFIVLLYRFKIDLNKYETVSTLALPKSFFFFLKYEKCTGLNCWVALVCHLVERIIWTVKRKLFLTLVGLYFFISGIDYSLILPSINFYLINIGRDNHTQLEFWPLGGAQLGFESMTPRLSPYIGASSNYTGVVMSAFSFAGLVAAPLFGKWTDRLGKLFTLQLKFFRFVQGLTSVWQKVFPRPGT